MARDGGRAGEGLDIANVARDQIYDPLIKMILPADIGPARAGGGSACEGLGRVLARRRRRRCVRQLGNPHGLAPKKALANPIGVAERAASSTVERVRSITVGRHGLTSGVVRQLGGVKFPHR